MKKIISLLLVLLLALTSAVAVNAEGIKDIFGGTDPHGSVTYSFDNGTLTCSGTGSIEYEDVPSAYESTAVAVVIENGITEIGNTAFYSYSNLSSVSIPNSVTSIGNSAFIRCPIQNVTIPASVTELGIQNFTHSAVESITFLGMNTVIGYDPGEDSWLGYMPGYNFPSTATIYGYTGSTAETYAQTYGYTFSALSGEPEQDSETPITYTISFDANGGNNAPASITKTRNVDTDLPTSTPTKSGSLFVGWATSANATEAAYQPGDVYSGNADATLYAVWKYDGVSRVSGTTQSGLTWVLENGALTISGSGAIGAYSDNTTDWKAYKDYISSITIGNGVTAIGDSAFSYLTKVNSVTIGSGVTTIGASAFSHCSALKSIDVPATVTAVEQSAFYNSGLETIYFNSENTMIKSASTTIPTDTVIVGKDNSIQGADSHDNAKRYATLFNRTFVSIDELSTVTFVTDRSPDDDLNLYLDKTPKIALIVPNLPFDEWLEEFGGIPEAVEGIAALREDFLGWSTIEGAAVPMYRPGDTYTKEGDATLYAVWKTLYDGDDNCDWELKEGVLKVTASNGGTYNSNSFDYLLGQKVHRLELYDFTSATIGYPFVGLESLYLDENVNSVTFGVIRTGLDPDYGTGLDSYNCLQLKEIIVDEDNTTYASHEGVLYNKSMTTLMYLPLGKSGEYEIPTGVTNIAALEAPYQYRIGDGSDMKIGPNLRHLIVPASVTEVPFIDHAQMSSDYQRNHLITVTHKGENGNNHTVNLDVNGGTLPSGSSSTLTKVYGQALTLPIPTKLGKVFCGWQIPTDEYTFIPNVYDIYYCDTDTAETLTAVWEDDQYLQLPSNSATAEQIASYEGVNSIKEGYTAKESKVGNVNGTSKSWIRQSAQWTDQAAGEALLTIDYSYTPDVIYNSKDVMFICDVSGSMGMYTAQLEHIVNNLAASLLSGDKNNRVAYLSYKTAFVQRCDFTDNLGDIFNATYNTNVYSSMWDDEIYSMALDQAKYYFDNRADKSRQPLIIFMSDGVHEGNGYISADNIYGGDEARALKYMDCEIATIAFDTGSYQGWYYNPWSPYDYHGFTTRGVDQLSAIASDPSMMMEAANINQLANAFTEALYAAADETEYELVSHIDTNYFEAAPNATFGGSGADYATLENNVITWDLSELNPMNNYTITLPLKLVDGAQPRPRTAGRGDAGDGEYPTNKEDEDIAVVESKDGSGAILNNVNTPVLTRGASDTNYIRYWDDNTLLREDVMSDSTHTLTSAPIQGTEDGIPTKAGYLFAGWYTTAQTPGTTSGTMFPQNITIEDYDDANGDLNLYAAWVAIGSVTVDNSDPNKNAYGSGTLNGFNLEGVQIKNRELGENGDDSNVWGDLESRPFNGMRFVTVYRNGMLTQLDSLINSTDENPNYTQARDVAPTYGYIMYAKTDINSLAQNSLKRGLTGSTDVDCTKDGNKNHKMFTDYRLSTVVIKYTSADYLSRKVEARAYVKYTDANGFERTAYNTYTGTTFAGGCRACYNEAQVALTKIVSQQ